MTTLRTVQHIPCQLASPPQASDTHHETCICNSCEKRAQTDRQTLIIPTGGKVANCRLHGIKLISNVTNQPTTITSSATAEGLRDTLS